MVFLLLLDGVGAGGYCQEVGQSGLGEGLELCGGDVGEGLHQVGGQAFVDLGRDHLAVAFRNLEGAVDAAYEVAHHVVADAVEFGVGDGLLLQTVYFVEYLVHGVGGGLSGDVGGNVKRYAVAEDLGLAVDAVGVAFVFAQVAHETGAEVAAEQGVEHHKAGVVEAVPRKGKKAAYAYG